jgi:hypothetical protein
LPVTVTVPVETVTPEDLSAAPSAETEIEPLEKVLDPTIIILLSLVPVPAPIVTAPETVKLFVLLMVIVFELAPPLIVKLAQTAAVFIITLKLSGIITSSVFIGAAFLDQFVPRLQFPPEAPFQVFVAAFITPEPISRRKINKHFEILKEKEGRAGKEICEEVPDSKFAGVKSIIVKLLIQMNTDGFCYDFWINNT